MGPVGDFLECVKFHGSFPTTESPSPSSEGFLELDLSDAEKQSVKAINLEVPTDFPGGNSETWGTPWCFFGQMGGSIFWGRCIWMVFLVEK